MAIAATPESSRTWMRRRRPVRHDIVDSLGGR
jgi:hypothetical protein